ncbi:MAG: DinB family protein, partial [Chloroflexota bacterium]
MLLDSIRGWHLSQMEKGISILKNVVDAVSHEALTTYRDGGVGWTTLEVLCHLRDFEEVFLIRA